MAQRHSETDRIQQVYRGYFEQGFADSRWSLRNPGNLAIEEERAAALARLLGRTGLLPLCNQRILEVGCGAGGTLGELITLGASPELLWGIDLIPERIEAARIYLPRANLRVADARALPFPDGQFDLVMVFTVFSSILDGEVAGQAAREITRVLQSGGAVVWYDFQYNNPRNPHVRGIKRAQVHNWFPRFTSAWETLTLIPPLARCLGTTTPFLYPLLAAIPALRTHLMGVLFKSVHDENSVP